MSAETKIVTLQDDYHVWTRREGQGPIKMLLLHGGPGMTHGIFGAIFRLY